MGAEVEKEDGCGSEGLGIEWAWMVGKHPRTGMDRVHGCKQVSC